MPTWAEVRTYEQITPVPPQARESSPVSPQPSTTRKRKAEELTERDVLIEVSETPRATTEVVMDVTEAVGNEELVESTGICVEIKQDKDQVDDEPVVKRAKLVKRAKHVEQRVVRKISPVRSDCGCHWRSGGPGCSA